MREHFSYRCKSISDHRHDELKSADVLEIFRQSYMDCTSPISLEQMSFTQQEGRVEATVTFARDGAHTTLTAAGNGSLDAVSNALKSFTGLSYKLKVYTEHSLQGSCSDSTAAAYIGLEGPDGSMSWGAGADTDIIRASVHALLAACNHLIRT